VNYQQRTWQTAGVDIVLSSFVNCICSICRWRTGGLRLSLIWLSGNRLPPTLVGQPMVAYRWAAKKSLAEPKTKGPNGFWRVGKGEGGKEQGSGSRETQTEKLQKKNTNNSQRNKSLPI